MKHLLIAIAIFSASFAQAALLTYEQGNLQLDGVNLNRTAAITDTSGQASNLKMDLLGAGLRSKTVLFVATKVYVIQLFSDSKSTFTRDQNAIASLEKAKFTALKISMLRTVDAASLASSFKDALQANGLAIDSELATLLKLMESSADGTQGRSISLLMKSIDGKTDVYYEDTKGAMKSFRGSAQLKAKILSIWLGKPADDGLKSVKAQLLKPVY